MQSSSEGIVGQKATLTWVEPPVKDVTPKPPSPRSSIPMRIQTIVDFPLVRRLLICGLPS